MSRRGNHEGHLSEMESRVTEQEEPRLVCLVFASCGVDSLKRQFRHLQHYSPALPAAALLPPRLIAHPRTLEAFSYFPGTRENLAAPLPIPISPNKRDK